VRITFVITGLGTGGAEMMLLKLLQHGPLLRGGRVIALQCGGELAGRFKHLGQRVDCLSMKAGVPNPLAIWRLVKFLRNDRPDVVSTWMYHADVVGGLAARIAGIPVVWGIRNSTLGTSTKFTTRAMVWLAAHLSKSVPTRIISCSEEARAVHEQIGYAKDRFRVIPNGFDLGRFRPCDEARSSVRSELGLRTGTPLVGHFARLDPQKNHLGFLDAARRVLEQRADAHFLLVGEGVVPGNAEFARAIDASDLRGSVSLLGRRDDVPRLMAALDVLVSSSSFGEAFPNVLGEAMACEVPCVTTDVGDSSMIVADTGIVVAVDDMAGLADAVLCLLSMPLEERRTLGQRARRRVEAEFSIQSVVSRYQTVFAEAVAASNPGARHRELEERR
jgi:glycosyltransferase involved in cell wall biosynthesis